MIKSKHKKIRRMVSASLICTVIMGSLTSNCFAMKRFGPPARSNFGPSRFLNPPMHTIGAPKPPVPHVKYSITQNKIASFSESWVNLGIDISAAAFASGAIGQKAIEVSLQKIGSKGQAVILNSIMRAYGAIPGLESAARKAVIGLTGLRYMVSKLDDLNKHGVRFTVYVTYETHNSCNCDICKDHGDRQLFPHVRIDASTY